MPCNYLDICFQLKVVNFDTIHKILIMIVGWISSTDTTFEVNFYFSHQHNLNVHLWHTFLLNDNLIEGKLSLQHSCAMFPDCFWMVFLHNATSKWFSVHVALFTWCFPCRSFVVVYIFCQCGKKSCGSDGVIVAFYVVCFL